MFFRDLIGHAAVVGELRRAIAEGRLPHALLFAGRRGVGKQLVARAVAAALLCESGHAPRAEACGACTACALVRAGTHPDLERVEREPGKRDIGIARIRELLDALHRKPHHGRGRVAIVDDAERLSHEAQNAFLKTLEEPPAGTTLVLVTDVAERLLPTVRSRCATHRFGRLSEPEMAAFVERDRERLGAVPASLSSGSPGLLRTLAEAPIANARRTVLELAEAPAAISPFEFAARLLGDCGARDDEEDPDARERTRDRLALALRLLSFALRDLLVLSLGMADVPLRHEDARERLAAASVRRDPNGLQDGIDLCDETILLLRRNADPALALESLAARLAAADSLQFQAAS